MPQDKMTTKGRKRWGKSVPKPKKEKEPREPTQAYQRRAFKKLIKKELNKQCDQIFNELFTNPKYAEEIKSDQAVDQAQNPEWVANLAQ